MFIIKAVYTEVLRTTRNNVTNTDDKYTAITFIIKVCLYCEAKSKANFSFIFLITSNFMTHRLERSRCCLAFLLCVNTLRNSAKLTEQMRFRISYTFSFDFMRTVWWCPSCSIGYVWPFMELQLTALSALTPTQAYWGGFK